MQSSPDLLALHAVRVLGSASSADAAALYGLEPAPTHEALLDAEAFGWARQADWYGVRTWSLTERGKAENERQLAVELDGAGARDVVAAAHRAFLPLNRRHGAACTRWQLNEHADERVDAAVLRELRSILGQLERVCAPAAEAIGRFGVHVPRYRVALDHLLTGDRAWLDAPDRPSCHLVWISLHEDFLATLGIERGTDDRGPELP